MSRSAARIAGVCLTAALFGGFPLDATAQAANDGEIFKLDLEDLLDMTITSVSKTAELANEAAAAVYVLTSEDMRRTGARNIPDALRGVPGLHVAQLSGTRWSVSSRGFPSLFADKLLVLVDGRSIYTPLFAGVYWDAQNLVLEDVDRIEVIRGPGGTLWGSNAVNGVINIVTKRAEESQGTYLQAGGGFTQKFFTQARHGGSLGRLGHWRVSGNYLQHAGLGDSGATPGEDPSDLARASFRGDFATGANSELTIQGDLYHGHSQVISFLPDPTSLQLVQDRVDGDFAGGSLQARSSVRWGEASEASVQISYDVSDRDDEVYDYHRGTLDLEAQHRFRVLDFADLTWGGGYRRYRDDIDQTFHTRFDPERRTFDLTSGFAQTELHLLDDKLRLTAGTKLEHNDFTGLEHQPSARLAFLPTPELMFWGSVSRATRTPTRAVADANGGTINSLLPPTISVATELQFARGSGASAEDLTAYELGIRVRPIPTLLVDVAAFYNRYDRFQTVESGPLRCSDGTPITDAASVTACGAGGNRLQQSLVADNRSHAQSKGLEALLRLQVSDGWQIDLAYEYFHLDIHLDADSSGPFQLTEEGQWPDQQASIRSRGNLPGGVTLDAGLFYVDKLSAFDVDSYFRLDLRVGYPLTDRIELGLVGQNLLEEHEEISSQLFFLPAEVSRSVFATVTWRY